MRSQGVKLLPIVMLTVKRDPAHITKALALGADGYISKPYSKKLPSGPGILGKIALYGNPVFA
jgi:DNA-binding NarL/FixJ family response regulator